MFLIAKNQTAAHPNIHTRLNKTRYTIYHNYIENYTCNNRHFYYAIYLGNDQEKNFANQFY